MNDSRSEYLEGRPKKSFQVVAAEPDYAPINARDRVIEDNTLDLGARLMFVRLLDLSTRSGDNDHYGCITISQNKLAHKFDVSLRTIWSWKQQLLARGVIWMSRQFMPNAWPMDTYHVAELDPPGKTEGRTTKEGMWGNGARRPGLDQVSPGARRNLLHSEVDFRVAEKSSFLPTNAAPSSNPLPLSVATHCDGEPQPVATPSSNPLRRGTAASCEPPSQPTATGSSSPLRLATETGCELKKSKSAGSSIPKSPFKRSTAVNASKKLAGGAKLDQEKTFLEELEEVLTRFNPKKSEAEMASWGGWWRNRLREDPRKAKNILGDIKSAVLEGRVKVHPGKMAVDLWKRLP